MQHFLLVPMLAAFLATTAVARPADLSEAAEPPVSKTVGGAYGSMLLGIAGPILLGSAMAGQGGGTNEAIGAWLIAGGIFVGPSAGQFYAESYGAGMLGTGLRVGGAALTLAGVIQSLGEGSDDGALLGLIGIGTFVAGGLHSLIDTRSAVDRYRDRVRADRYGLTPTLTPVDGELRPGALAWMRF